MADENSPKPSAYDNDATRLAFIAYHGDAPYTCQTRITSYHPARDNNPYQYLSAPGTLYLPYNPQHSEEQPYFVQEKDFTEHQREYEQRTELYRAYGYGNVEYLNTRTQAFKKMADGHTRLDVQNYSLEETVQDFLKKMGRVKYSLPCM